MNKRVYTICFVLALFTFTNQVLAENWNCSSTLNDLGSGYLIGGEFATTTPDITQLRQILKNNNSYLAFSQVDTNAAPDCANIESTDRMWSRNGHQSATTIGIYNSDQSDRPTWDMFVWLWQTDLGRICYYKQQSRQYWWHCMVPTRDTTIDKKVCPDGTYISLNGSSYQITGSDPMGQIYIYKVNKDTGQAGQWMGVHVYDSTSTNMLLDSTTSEYTASNVRVRVYNTSDGYFEFSPKTINGRGGIFEKNYTFPSGHTTTNWTLYVENRHSNYELPLTSSAYPAPYVSSYCANYEYECNNWFGTNWTFDYNRSRCINTTDTQLNRTQPTQNILRVNAKLQSVNVSHKWADIAPGIGIGNSWVTLTNLTFFQTTYSHPNLTRLGIYGNSGYNPPTHHYRYKDGPIYEMMAFFYDNVTNETCFFKQQYITDNTNQSNETFWVNFDCATINPQDTVNFKSYNLTDTGYFPPLETYSNLTNDLLKSQYIVSNRKTFGLEEGAQVWIDYANATHMMSNMIKRCLDPCPLKVSNTTVVAETVLDTGPTMSHKYARGTTSPYTQFYLKTPASYQNKDVLGAQRIYYDYNWCIWSPTYTYTYTDWVCNETSYLYQRIQSTLLEYIETNGCGTLNNLPTDNGTTTNTTITDGDCGGGTSPPTPPEDPPEPPKEIEFDPEKVKILVSGENLFDQAEIFAVDWHAYASGPSGEDSWSKIVNHEHYYTIQSTVPILFCYFREYDCEVTNQYTITLNYPKGEDRNDILNDPFNTVSEVGFICPSEDECYHYAATYWLFNLNWRIEADTGIDAFPFISPNGYNLWPWVVIISYLAIREYRKRKRR